MSELRRDPITGRWVIIAAERGRRPADFIREPVKQTGGFCPFCYGNESKTPPEILAYRPGQNGERNVSGWTVRVVPNKFPALAVEGELDRQAEGIYDRMNGTGAHEVIIETPEHSHTLATMPVERVKDVLYAWRDRTVDLRNDPRLKYVMIFKNHGASAGATLEHPHSQLIALPIVPRQVIDELRGAKDYFQVKERCIFCDIIHQERKARDRVVHETEQFLTLAPYAPRFPFETWILPKQHTSAFENSPAHRFDELAGVLKTLAAKAERALDCPAFNIVVHTAPVHDPALEYYHWHIEFMPKLTNVAGFEWGTGFYINPTSPEEAAKFLREAKAHG